MTLLFLNLHARHNTGVLCKFKNEYTCHKIGKEVLKSINLPPEACAIHDCTSCVKGYKSFLIDDNHILQEPSHFLLKRVAVNSSELTLLHIADNAILTNPDKITLDVCLFDKKLTYKHRQLLMNEEAKFINDNLTLSFQDPILTCPAQGKLIIKTEDFQQLFTVPENLQVIIPFELLAFKTTIEVVYIHPSGRTVSGEIHVEGKPLCQLRHCIFCLQFYKFLNCYSSHFTYIFYTACALVMVLIFYLAKTIAKSIIYILKLLFLVFYALYKIFKLMARCSLLLGAYLGLILNKTIISSYAFLEEQTMHRPNLPMANIVLLALCLLFDRVHSDCNSQAIIQSELRTCENSADGRKICQMFTTAEITLPAIGSETCLWFTDKDEKHLFSLQIKLDAVLCEFQTKRDYFTFPVEAKHLSQVSCFYNEWCGQGEHCTSPKINFKQKFFESQTMESADFPSLSSCVAGGIGTGCFVLTRAACNFYRTFYVPDLLYSYEVSSITGHTCKYKVSITNVENNTVSTTIVTDSAYTDTGIKISILGSYDQPQMHLKDSLIQRVSNPSESYLAHTSAINHPQAGRIGQIQANHSYTKAFIFDPTISTCDFFEDRLRCQSSIDPLTKLTESQFNALPMERDLHLLSIQKGKLTSTLLYSAAVRVQLHFSSYKLTLQTNTVCPQFEETTFSIQGCYKCKLLARMTFKAFSSCKEGVALVSFQNINIHSKALYLTTSATSHTIKFLAENKCYNEKICLKSNTLIKCHVLEFCLQEPSIELMNIFFNSTMIKASKTDNKWWKIFNFENFNASFFLFKYIGSVLFIICITITAISTFISCCCRR